MAKFGEDWLQLEDFYFSVDSGGIVRPEAQQGVNHGNYTEAETFYAHALTTTGQQCTLIFQLCFSNLGPSASCLVSGRFCVPGDPMRVITATFSALNFNAATSQITYTVSADSQNDGINAIITKDFAQRTIGVNLTSTRHRLAMDVLLRPVRHGYRLNGGKTWYYRSGPVTPFGPDQTGRIADGYILEHFMPFTDMTGTLTIDNHVVRIASGGGLFTHAVQAIKPHLAASAWNIYVQFDHAKRALLHMVTWTAPKAYGHAVMNIGAMAMGGDIVAVFGANRFHVHSTQMDHETGYALPLRTAYEWHGETPTGVGVHARAEAALVTLLGRHDVLEHLPHWIRVIVQRLITKPFLYQWLEHGTAQVHTDGDGILPVSGPVIFETVFL